MPAPLLVPPSLLTDRSGAPPGQPRAILRPRSVDDVRDALRTAAADGTHVVPRGAGTGLAGGATATAGAVVLDLTALDRIERIEVPDQYAVVEPGVVTAHLDAAARTQALFYAPDPASAAASTIGGNIATNAGGMRCVKYGVTSDAVLALDVVLADGRLLRTGRRTVKGVTGYDLTSLFVGSEGTLGIIVGATVRLRPVPARIATLTAGFASLGAAAHACMDLTASGLTPALLELLDGRTLDTIDRAHGTKLADIGRALVIAQVDGPDAERQARAVADVLERSGALVEWTTDPTRSDELLQARRLALPSIEAFERPLIEDICVPRSRLAEAVVEIERIADRLGVTVHTFAHAGDGNLHPILSYDRAATETPPAVLEAADLIFDLSRRLGGTVTGEHGVGLTKRAHARLELGDTALDVHAAIKAALDPAGLLNPGKAF